MTLEKFKECIQIDFPNIITNEWLDKIEETDNQLYDMISRWGFCYKDMSKHDLSNLDINHLNKLTFNSSTIWPSADKMPKDFNPQKLLEERKNPMMGIMDLHNKGITGKGVIVATIDSGYQGIEHVEFAGSKIKAIDVCENPEYHFHAEGVLANLCGQNVGIAPEVKVYHYNTQIGGSKRDLTILKALKDILNKVENGINIRAVNISGALCDNKELKSKVINIVEKLESYNCEVIDSAIFGKTFTNVEYGINSDIKNKEDVDFAKWANKDHDLKKVGIVCGGKVVPEFCNNDGYKYEQESCYSWTIPQAVGLYALCLQVNKNLTWKDFENMAKESAITNEKGIKVVNPKGIVKLAEKVDELIVDI